MELMIEEGYPVVFTMRGSFIEHCFEGLNYHTYLLDIGKAGHLYVSVYAEDVSKVELHKPYTLKMRLFGHYKHKRNGQQILDNVVKVYDFKKITEEKGAN